MTPAITHIDLPRNTSFDKVIYFLVGGYPNIHAIVATTAFYIAHILLYIICLEREIKMDYQPMIVSELALDPIAASVYQTVLLITLISGYIVIHQRYLQVYRFIPGSKLNKVTYILGVYSQFHMPLIFMYELDSWPLVHQIVAFKFFVIMTIYIALNAVLTRQIVERSPGIIKNSRGFIVVKFSIVVSSTILVIIQISLLVYKKSTSYVTEYNLPHWKWLNITASVFEWLHICSLILGVLLFAYEMKPNQLAPLKDRNAIMMENA